MTPLARLTALLDGRALTAAYDPAPWAAWLSEHGDQVRDLIEEAAMPSAIVFLGRKKRPVGWGELSDAVAPFLREQPENTDG